MPVIRSTARVPLLVVAAMVLFGCTDPASDEDSAGASSPSSPATSVSERPTIGPSPGGDLGAVAPCDLLSQPEQASLNLGAGQARTNDGRQVCAFPATDESYVVAVSLYPEEGLDAIAPDTILKSPMRIGRHDAVQHHENNTICVFSIAVGPSSSVDVGATFAKPTKDITPADFDQSCQYAQTAAGLVEPRLP